MTAQTTGVNLALAARFLLAFLFISNGMNNGYLKELLHRRDILFWDLLDRATRKESECSNLILLSALRRKAISQGFVRDKINKRHIRLAILSGYNTYPFREILEHLLESNGITVELWLGNYNNYVSEILDESSALYAFKPDHVLIIPSEDICKYSGKITDEQEGPRSEAAGIVDKLIQLCHLLHDKIRAEIILTNFFLPIRHDLGGYRSRILASDWNFRKYINLELGLKSPSFLHICDLEFQVYRIGGINAWDDRGWFESKQLGSPLLLVQLAQEVVHMIRLFEDSAKKVLVLDLDNTLWGGILAEDGIDGIELGDISARGEAFKAFQKSILSLKKRGVLLAAVSKNDPTIVEQAFRENPEMVLKREDFASFKINWDPKPDNIRLVAEDLRLDLNKFVFVDDNPAEIEIVNRFLPQVETIKLDCDPSEYVARLQDCRLFESGVITSEDVIRSEHYASENRRKQMAISSVDMDSYLESLGMEMEIESFKKVSIPRIVQLINKSNQFNLTTRRTTEGAVLKLMDRSENDCFSIRLRDRFGDLGLISVVMAEQIGLSLHIQNWLMSCRVLKRQVEIESFNELLRRAELRGCDKIIGIYIPTEKNSLVKDLYRQLGFTLSKKNHDRAEYELPKQSFCPRPTKIKIHRP